MAYNYPSYTAINGVYGGDRPHKYQPASYHNPTAAKRSNKSRWLLKPPQQYEVFRVADDNYVLYSEDSGLYGFLDGMNEVLGRDNEEHIAFFPKAAENVNWHGYPVGSKNILDETIDRWHNAGLITDRNYRLLLKRLL